MDLSGKCIILSAPSGSGKTTIMRNLLKQDLNLAFSISATTRNPREHEVDGEDYYFLSVEDFKEKIKNDEFLEWEEVYENQFYGTLKNEVERIWNDGQHLIFDVDVIGGRNLKKKLGENALAIFVKPPSIAVLKHRLTKRGTDDQSQLVKRINKAKIELTFEKYFDYILVNNSLSTAINEVVSIVSSFLDRKKVKEKRL